MPAITRADQDEKTHEYPVLNWLPRQTYCFPTTRVWVEPWHTVERFLHWLSDLIYWRAMWATRRATKSVPNPDFDESCAPPFTFTQTIHIGQSYDANEEPHASEAQDRSSGDHPHHGR